MTGVDPSEFNCPRCWTFLGPEARFCGQCGASRASSTQHHMVPGGRWQHLSAALSLWIWLLVCCGGIGIVANHADVDELEWDVYGTAGVALIVMIYALRYRADIADYWKLKSLPRSVWRDTVITVAAISLFAAAYFWVIEAIGMQTIDYLDTYREKGWPLWSAFLLISVAPGVFEEIAFRGVIFAQLERVGSQREAMIIQAAMFSILHLMPAIFISHFVIGLAFGWLRQRSKSLIPGMIAHASYNAIILLQELAA